MLWKWQERRSGKSNSFRTALRHMLATACCAAAFVVSAAAQITTGTVAGTVVDGQGGVLPGATIALISETRGTRSVQVVTNAQGDFVIPNLTADTYTVEVTLTGFKTLTRRGVPVSGGDRVPVSGLTMEVGGTTETVDVTAEAPMIQAQSGERSFTASTEQIQNLPLASRNFSALTSLTPGVDGNDRLGGGGQNNTMMDGVSTMDTGNNAALLPLNVEAIAEVRVLTSNYQAEFGRSSGLQITAVTKSGTNRFHGSIYDVIRNSDWNSNSWANLQNGNPKPVSKQQDWGYSLGGPIGRPGGNNKLFFFFSQEWRPRTTGGQVRQFRFPTALERQGDFSQSLNNNGARYNLIRDASTGLPCTANNAAGCFQDGGVVGRIPQDRLYPIGLNILKMYPDPNVDRSGVGYNYEATAPVVSYLNNQPAIRLDYQPFASLRGTFKYAGERQSRQTFPGTLPGFNDVQTHDPVITTISATVNYTLNSTTFVEATYGYGRNAVAGCVDIFSNCLNAIPMSPASNKRNVGLGDLPVLFPESLMMDPRYYEYDQLVKIGTPFFENGMILLPPVMSWGNRVNPAPPSISYPSWLNYNLTQDLAISLTKVAGRHTFKAGFYNNHSHKAENRGPGGPGTINFGNNVNNPIDSSFGFANAALGIFNSYTQLSEFMEGRFVYDNTEFYLQDNWKVTSRLTLDYGIRFVRQGPQYDSLGQSANFLAERWDPAQAPLLYVAGCPNNANPCGNTRQAKHPLTGELLGSNSSLAIGQIVPGTGSPTNGLFLAGQGISEKSYEWPALAPAPRFGMAYDLSGTQSVVVRGGGGLFFDRPQGTTVYGLITNPPNASSVTVNFGRLATLGSEGLAVTGPPALNAFEYNAKLPSSAQWNGGIQIALPWSSALDVTYVGQYGFNLLNNVNINQVDFGAAYLAENQDPTLQPSSTQGATALVTDLMRSYRGFGNINVQIGRGWNRYHSIQSSFKRRFQGGLSFGINHTLGLSNRGNSGSRLEHAPDGTLRERADQAEADELLGDLQLQRHTIKANFVWDMPDLRDTSNAVSNVVAAVLNDWQLSGIYSGQSGNRYSLGYDYDAGGENVNLTGSPNYGGRVRIVGDTGSGCSGDQYRQFNTNAFLGPSVGSVGLESGQNYLVGCFENFWDMALARNIRFGGGRQVQLRVEVFNVFNTVVFNGRETTVELTNPSNQTVLNPQFDEDGVIDPDRLRPDNAGFGAATGAAALRSVQLQVRFQF